MDPLKFDVTGLDEGEEYLFRVTAINDEGESEPLVADAAIKAKNPFGELPFPVPDVVILFYSVIYVVP